MLKKLLLSLGILFFFITFPSKSFADLTPCQATILPEVIQTTDTIHVKIPNVTKGNTYYVSLSDQSNSGIIKAPNYGKESQVSGNTDFPLDLKSANIDPNKNYFVFAYETAKICVNFGLSCIPQGPAGCFNGAQYLQIKIHAPVKTPPPDATPIPGQSPGPGTSTCLRYNAINEPYSEADDVKIKFDNPSGNSFSILIGSDYNHVQNISGSGSKEVNLGKLSAGQHFYTVYPSTIPANELKDSDVCLRNSFQVNNNFNSNSTLASKFSACPELSSTGNCPSVSTGLGIDIPTNPEDFARVLIGILLSIGGAILLFVIMVSGYRIMTSQGDPEKLKAARESLTGAVAGMVFIIFSVAILSFIGFNLLHIPGIKP